MKVILRIVSRIMDRVSPALPMPVLATLVWAMVATFCPAAPPYEIEQTPTLCYVAKATWFDSMLASLAALQADETAGKRPAPRVAYHSDVVRGTVRCTPLYGTHVQPTPRLE